MEFKIQSVIQSPMPVPVPLLTTLLHEIRPTARNAWGTVLTIAFWPR